MKFKNIIFEKNKKVGVIKLNRPKYLKALCDELIKELNHVLDDIEANDNLSVLVLTVSEKVFAAGADISEMYNKKFTDLESNLIEPSYKINIRGKNREFFTILKCQFIMITALLDILSKKGIFMDFICGQY